MDRKKLDKLWDAINAARRSPLKISRAEKLAMMAGRTRDTGGNHPMWLSAFPQHRAFPIASHGGNSDLHPHVRNVILGHLEADASAWEDELEMRERKEGVTNGSG